MYKKISLINIPNISNTLHEYMKVFYTSSNNVLYRLLGQNGLLLKHNIKSGLLPKVMFKIAPLNPYQHKNQFFILFILTLPTSIRCCSLFPSHAVLCVIFSFKNLAPPVGH